jgi:hypothetical protein
MSTPIVNMWDSLIPGARPSYPAEEPWDAVWPLDGGTAWVFRSSPDRERVRRPVILADGFGIEKSNPHALYNGLENAGFPFVSALRDNGLDLVLLGYDERSASILDNSNVAIQCIRTAIEDREGAARLVVGGFSMGGLVTRYALAKMAHDGPEHETAIYLSYDSPHSGAWLPIGVQAFAHFVKQHWGGPDGFGPLISRFSNMVNSPAARQLMRWHIETAGAPVSQQPHQDRIDFLDELDRVGGWPADVLRLGVANGVDTGIGNGIDAGVHAMSATGPYLGGTQLDTQNTGQQVVAVLRKAGDDPVLVRTNDLPNIDGAPGGLFPEAPDLPGRPGNFGMAAMLAGLLEGEPANLTYNTSTFVPSVSAVAAGQIDDRDRLYRRIAQADSELHRFECAATNEGHTVMTETLGKWILDQLLVG